MKKYILLSGILIFLLIIVVALVLIYYSGEFIVMSYNVNVKSADSKIIKLEPLPSQNLGVTNFDKNIKINLISTHSYLIRLNDEVENFDIFLSSDGEKGGSEFLGDTTHLILIKINGLVVKHSSKGEVAYRVKKSINPQEFNIEMSFNNNYPFISTPQTLNEKIFVQWMPDEEFEKIQ